jgi:hypothetical protein
MSGSSTDVSAAQKIELAKGLRIDGFLGFAIALIAWGSLIVIERRSTTAKKFNQNMAK